jgi:hypothetical protein
VKLPTVDEIRSSAKTIDESIKKKRREATAAADAAKKTENKTESKTENKTDKKPENKTDKKTENKTEKKPSEKKKRDKSVPRPLMSSGMLATPLMAGSQGGHIQFAEVPVYPQQQQGPTFYRGGPRGGYERGRGHHNPRGGVRGQLRGGLSANIQVQFQQPGLPQGYANPGVYHAQGSGPSGHFVAYPQQGPQQASYSPAPPPYEDHY